MRPLIVIIAIILGLGALKIYVWDTESIEETSSAKPKASASSLPVDVYVAAEVSTDNTVYASGTIVANEEVELQSEVSGRLIALHIKEGGFVRKGQLIAKLADDDLQAQMKKLEYEDQLANQIELRQQKLLDIDAISKEEYDLAVNKLNTLQADKELLQVLIEKTSVRAPFNGRIGFKNISEGAYVTPGVVIANLVQTNPIKVDFAIPEKYANSVSVDAEITFEIDGVDDRFIAHIIAIDPSVDEDLRTLKLRASANNSLGLLRPGMFVRVELPLESQRSIMVPTEAVMPILKGKIAYVKKNGKANEVKVSTGLRTDRNIQILDGIEVGDSVIVSALMTLKPDLPVSTRNAFTEPIGD
ncbi:MAG: efflux RND transporter periplasmic adaptor subunit [Saprospiraceae bacterium]|nr:efflux RND transporter periplasmic adaptor subunit [Saprospiraceae bacterium]